ncbi:LuxR C-terminal-related transcriptional regulator [Geodermatophilus sp. CPCC 206100]|uniref:LuxR C-terminal-related transcriptional regulator n=1 Tax=Geodermatophilus sp. CPCC 206100 TaxID=3020054 RepID=UPI003AFFA65C
MAGPLLTTKLHVPRRRRGVVPRPRLSRVLDRGGEGALTLVSAPAGFGKTTLLTEWLATDGRAAAWVGLDSRDNDPVVFWTYLVEALRTAVPDVGATARALLQASHPSMDEVLPALVNDLDAVPDDVTLVLDDYHVVEAHAVHDGLVFLLDHLPPRIHLVIATRADPPLPLARLRARGELVEVRAAALRFTAEEAAAYLGEAMGLALTAQDVATLENRTEGWIAALQLAALSMQGRDDVAAFIAGFAGDDRYIVDYLAEEVLQRQPDDVRDFLLQTSVLTRLTGSLCDDVVDRDGGTAMLEALERANLFVVPLDDRRHWYRYHHLFADVLHARLLAERPDRVLELHRRASGWHARHGEPSEAIRHALAGGDAERAADLVELAMPAARRNREETTLRHWFRQLPEEVLRDRPLLRAGYAGAILVHGELDGVEEHLREAERWLDAAQSGTAPSPPGAPVDDAVVRAVRSQVAVYRAAQARMTGDLAGAMTHARRVLDLVGEDEHLLRGAASGLLGLGHWTGGDLRTAYGRWSDARAQLERAGHHSDTLGVALALADIRIAQGRLRDAMATYQQGLATATAHGASVLRGTADMHVGLSEVFLERNDLELARQHLAAAAELGEHAGLPQNRHRSRVALARVSQADGDLAGAVELLDEAERRYVSDMFPDVRPIAAVRARVWIAQGRVAEALDWARGRGLSVDDDPCYLSEFEHVTLVRALLASQGTPADRAADLLARLLRAAEDGERTGTVIELLVLQARARQASGDVPGALASLERALTLAEPEGHVRTVVDEGPPMAPLLRVLARQGSAPAYAGRLLAAVVGTGDGAPARQGLIEPLSVRELEVLRLLGTDLDGPGIARELVVSLNTVRTHTKNIYAKLGVTNRRAAVRRAADLALGSRAPQR